MYFSAYKKEIGDKPPIVADNNITYVVVDAPNGGGKSSICNRSTEIIEPNIDGAKLFLVSEPPEMHIEQLESDKTV